jgi:Leucine-rich repeat (LRR) protein
LPEIFGEMRNTPEINLYNTPIKELPFPFQSLIPPQTLHPCTIQDEGRVSPIKSSHLEYLSLCNGNLSDEYWAISFMLFTNLKELHLANNLFTVLPKSMEKCNLLWRLVLDDCVDLQEIKGIPPCLKVLSALNCQLLTSSSKSKLLNQVMIYFVFICNVFDILHDIVKLTLVNDLHWRHLVPLATVKDSRVVRSPMLGRIVNFFLVS